MSFLNKKTKTVTEKKVIDGYSDSDNRLSKEDAHRDVQYNIPSTAKQLWITYMIQMKLYMKGKIPWLFLMFALLIPIIIYSGIFNSLIDSLLNRLYPSSGNYIRMLLTALVPMMVLTSAIALSKNIPSEFKDRTAYLNLALPQSRFTFYLGKFLAGLTIIFVLFFLVIGLCIFIANGKYETAISGLLSAMALIFGGLFAFCGTIYGLSVFFKKGSAILPLIVLFVALPLIFGYAAWKYSSIADLIGYLPVFAGDYAQTLLGADLGITVSVAYVFGVINDSTMPNIALALISYIIWGIAFLSLGYYFFKRREM